MSHQYPVLKVVSREFLRISKDPMNLFFLLIGPVTAFLLIALIFSANTPVNLPVGIVDLDGSSLSRKIIRMIDATPVAEVKRGYLSLTEARKAVECGELDAVVAINKNTEADILRGERVHIAVFINNAYLIKGGVLSSGIQKAIGTVSSGIRLQSRLMSGESRPEALADILPVQIRPILLFNPYTSYSYYLTILLVPVMLTVFVLFGSLYAIGTELQDGTGADWLESADGRILPALAGKLFPYTVGFCVLALLMDLILFRMLGLPLRGRLALILSGEMMLILSYQSMAIFILGLTKNLRLGLSVASAWTMLALTYAGLTFPLFGMPLIAKVISRIFPYTYWLSLFTGQTLRGEPVAYGMTQLIYLSGFILLGMCLVPRLKFLLDSGKYSGRK